MLDHLDPPVRAKLISAYHAMTFVEDGMRVGLGTGSTAAWLVKLLGARRHVDGLEIKAVPTSDQTARLAAAVGIPLTTLDEAGWLDLTIDGADEIDPVLCLIKGGGGALLREKIVATASDRMIVIADPSKIVARLGAFPLPVEVVKFGAGVTQGLIEDRLDQLDVKSRTTRWRMAGDQMFVTDEGHYLLDLLLDEITDVDALSDALLGVPGAVETGLFIDIADTVVIGVDSGEARLLYASEDERVIDIEDTAHFEALMIRMDETGMLT